MKELYISLTNLLHLGNNLSCNIKPVEQYFKEIQTRQEEKKNDIKDNGPISKTKKKKPTGFSEHKSLKCENN